jgi:predicted acylesterase/phospholipase RssA
LEEADIHPDIVAGVSIGAFNGAIIAANPGKAAPAIEAFWNDVAIVTCNDPRSSARGPDFIGRFWSRFGEIINRAWTELCETTLALFATDLQSSGLARNT